MAMIIMMLGGQYCGYQPTIGPVSPPCSLSQNNSDNESNFRSPFITSVMPDKIIYNTRPTSRDVIKRGYASQPVEAFSISISAGFFVKGKMTLLRQSFGIVSLLSVSSNKRLS